MLVGFGKTANKSAMLGWIYRSLPSKHPWVFDQKRGGRLHGEVICMYNVFTRTIESSKLAVGAYSGDYGDEQTAINSVNDVQFIVTGIKQWP